MEIVEVDGQFEPLRGNLAEMGITLNKCSHEEHVPVAERRIRKLKERCRCILNTLPFPKLPGMLIVQMVSTCNFWLNIYPPKDGVSRNINPQELITGVQIDYKKHIRADYGEYVQVHEERGNSMKTRTTGAIATRPTGNVQGGHWFYSLTTGRMLDRMRWTPLPMPADVIERVAALAKNSPVGLNFTNMRNKEYGENDDSDSDNNSDYESEDDSNRDDDDYDDFIAEVDRHNADPPDPPDANADINPNNEEDDSDKDDDDADALPNPPDNDSKNDEIPENNVGEDDAIHDAEDDEIPVLPAPLKKLTDYNGALPPILEYRKRQKAQGTNETLVTTEEEEWTKPVSKKQRKIQRDLQKQTHKRDEEQNKRKLGNKQKNEKRRSEIKERKKDEKAKEEPHYEFRDLRDQLRTEQKPGVSFPHDSCSSKDLTPELEAIALTQYSLKRGLKEFGNDGLIALGKQVEQLYTRKVS
jgi:hypothetical protein